MASPELEIGLLLKSDKLRHDPRNHAIPLLDILKDDSDPEHSILVFPLLRRLDAPRLASVREAVDFVGQTLEVRTSCSCRVLGVGLTMLKGTSIPP